MWRAAPQRWGAVLIAHMWRHARWAVATKSGATVVGYFAVLRNRSACRMPNRVWDGGVGMDSNRRLARGGVVVVVLAASIVALQATPAQATTFLVDTIADTVDANPGDGTCADSIGDCSLRAAIHEIMNTAGPHVIQLVGGNTYTLTIGGRDEYAPLPLGVPSIDTPTHGDLDIRGTTVTIEGVGGVGNEPATIDADGIDRVFEVRSNASATFRNLVITGGSSTGTADADFGGGVRAIGPTVFENVRVEGNTSYKGAGIHPDSPATHVIRDSAIVDNVSTYNGGGLFVEGGTMVTIERTELSGNTATNNGGAIYISKTARVTMRSSTVSGNGGQGAIYTVGASVTPTNLDLEWSTVAQNNAVGIFNTLSGGGAPRVVGSIVGDQVGSFADCGGPAPTMISLGNNLDSDGSCGLAGTGDLSSVEPLLGPLADNGGIGLSHAPRLVSPAIDAGGACSGPNDQANVARPAGAACDLGAIEAQHVVEVYGATFDAQDAEPSRLGDLPSEGESGHGLKAVEVPDWTFDPGAAAWFLALTDHGRVVASTMSLGGNQTNGTMDTMSVGVLDPRDPTGPQPSFARVGFTTSLNQAAVRNSLNDSGGADVSDVCRVDTAEGSVVVGFSAVPWKGWNLLKGVFPTMISLEDEAGAGASQVAVDFTKTARLLRDDWSDIETFYDSEGGTSADRAYPAQTHFGQRAPRSMGSNECAALANGDIVVTQYFTDSEHYTTPTPTTGRIVVLSPEGEVLDLMQLPNYEAPVGGMRDASNFLHSEGAQVSLLPREVQADPQLRNDGTESRFTVLHDALINGNRVTFPIQEFAWDGSTISMRSQPVVSVNPASPTESYEKLVYDTAGNLLAIRSGFFGWLAARSTYVFAPGELAAIAPADTTCTEDVDDRVSCTNDQTIDYHGSTGFTEVTQTEWTESFIRAGNNEQGAFNKIFSVDVMPLGENTDLIVATSWHGVVRTITWNHSTRQVVAVHCDVDTAIPSLFSGDATVTYQVRQGVIDPETETVYVPVKNAGTGTKLTSPPQYVAAVDLGQAQHDVRQGTAACS